MYESIFDKEAKEFRVELERLKSLQKQKLKKIESLLAIKKNEYSKNFNRKFKERIKKRDFNTCQLCGAKEKLVVHHIDYKKVHTSPENNISLCDSCNKRVNANRAYWHMFFRNKIHYQVFR